MTTVLKSSREQVKSDVSLFALKKAVVNPHAVERYAQRFILGDESAVVSARVLDVAEAGFRSKIKNNKQPLVKLLKGEEENDWYVMGHITMIIKVDGKKVTVETCFETK